MLKTIADDATSEVIEKKSRFIANIFYVESLEEAEEKTNSLLSSLKSKSASFSFISRSSIGYQTIFKKNNGY